MTPFKRLYEHDCDIYALPIFRRSLGARYDKTNPTKSIKTISTVNTSSDKLPVERYP
ncbi:MAG: hypothetical protein QW510_05350 [Candidatus Bathyarchaeia archaeon]